MSRYLDLLRNLNSENVPPLGTVLTAKSPSDSFDSTEGCRFPESQAGQQGQSLDAWTPRRTVLTDAWHRDWSATWKRGGAPVTAETLPDAITRTVTAWNATTGDRRTTAEYRAHLSPADLDDPKIMNRAWLGLYAWTLWANVCAPAPDRETNRGPCAFEQRPAHKHGVPN